MFPSSSMQIYLKIASVYYMYGYSTTALSIIYPSASYIEIEYEDAISMNAPHIFKDCIFIPISTLLKSSILIAVKAGIVLGPSSCETIFKKYCTSDVSVKRTCWTPRKASISNLECEMRGIVLRICSVSDTNDTARSRTS